MALDEAERILASELNPEHKSYQFLLGRKSALAVAILTATTRVAPGRLRGAETDHMEDILAAIREERTKIAGLN